MPHANKPSSSARQAPLGRTPRDTERRERKSRPLSIYLNPVEEAAVRRAAAARGIGVSEFGRRMVLLDLQYGTGDLVEQVYLLAPDSSNHSELDYQIRVWVKGLTGVAMAPPVEPPAPKPAPEAAMPPSALRAPPKPASVEALVPLAEPEPVLKPAQWKQKIGAIALTILTDLFTVMFNVMFDLLTGIWRWLIRRGSRPGEAIAGESMYDRLIGRTPLQFLLAAVMLVALPIAAFGRTEVGLLLLDDDQAKAAPALSDLSMPVQNLIAIGDIVMEAPGNTARINACLEKQKASRHNFMCKFEMKAGA